MRKNSKGFAPILIVLVIVVLGIVGYYVFRNQISLLPSTDIVTPTPSAISKLGTVRGWLVYVDPSGKFNFEYPSSKTIFVDKLNQYPLSFLTNNPADGVRISLTNNGGGQIDIYNNPEKLTLTQALVLKDKQQKAVLMAANKTIEIGENKATIRYEDWGPGGETVVVYISSGSNFIVASRGVAAFDPKETVQMAEQEIVSIMKTFKFTN